MKIGLIALLLSACTTSVTEPVELYEESPGPDENMEFAKIVKNMRDQQERNTPAHRNFHVKVHGCLSGTLSVLPDRPAVVREGLFKEARDYRVVMRFTNGTSKIQEDTATDARGLGLKVFGVKGEKLLPSQSEAETQDFIMNNVAVPFSGDPEEFAAFITAADHGTLSTLWFLSTHWTFTGRVMQLASHEVSSLINERYWSGIAVKLGPKAMKYNVRACGPRSENRDQTAEHYLGQDLATMAAQHELCWELGVQLQKDPVQTPIEDVTVEWTEELTPTIPVARIRIPKQDIRANEVMQACQSLNFTPWHAGEEHRPLGRFGRIRRPIYALSQRVANGGNVPAEPRDFPVRYVD